jgi:CRP/FNR family transcriptional regulator, cyclic AMP receptor protein
MLEGFVRSVQLQRNRVVQLLKNSALLGALPEDVIEKLVMAGQQRTYSKGQVVFRNGEPGDSALIVISGYLKVMNITQDGREVTLNFLAEGDLVGEVAALDGRARMADVIAVEESKILAIFRRDLVPVLLKHPLAMMEIVEALCGKLRIATSIIEDGVFEMQARLARGIIRLAHQHGMTRSNGICIDLELSQSELGSYVGLSRANVSRQLKQLRATGVIESDGSKIVVLNSEKLAEIARSTGEPSN